MAMTVGLRSDFIAADNSTSMLAPREPTMVAGKSLTDPCVRRRSDNTLRSPPGRPNHFSSDLPTTAFDEAS